MATKILSIAVSPYGGKLSMTALNTLEEMVGIDIVVPLAKRHTEVISIAEVILSKSEKKKLAECETKLECFEFVINHWKSKNSKYQRNWATLLFILKMVGLTDLCQQLQDCIGKYKYLKATIIHG